MSMLLSVVMVLGFADCADPAAAAVAATRLPAGGWTIPAAFYAVAMGNSAQAVPKGIAVPELAAVPLRSELWVLAAANLAKQDQMNLSLSPEVMIHDSLQRLGVEAGRRVSQTLSRPDNADELSRLAELAPVVLPVDVRRALSAALGEHDIRVARGLEAVRADARALAAEGVDPRVIVAQYAVQSVRHLYRGLTDYDYFLSLSEREPYSRPSASSLTALLRHETPIQAMVDDMRRRHGTVAWADVGGGLGAALSEWSLKELGPDVRRTLVDLFDWVGIHEDMKRGDKYRQEWMMSIGHNVLDDWFVDAESHHGSEIFKAAHRPELILADAATVSFPRGARPNFITSFVSIPYWADKLRSIVNLYNRLEDGGIMVVAAEGRPQWPSWTWNWWGRSLFNEFVASLIDSGVELVAIVPNAESPVHAANVLVVRKKEGTRLVQQAPLHRAWRMDYGYVDSVYKRSGKGVAPVAVVARKVAEEY